MARILALDQDGNRLIPLLSSGTMPKEAHAALSKQKASDLFPDARAPEAALAGLWTYFSCFDQGHKIAQDIETPEGSFWHAILHRQEPDPGNAAYWFRQAGSHLVFDDLANAAASIAGQYPEAGFRVDGRWDPFAFIDFCEQARRMPGTPAERAALEIQRAEWQLLFDYCARSRS
ncbi:MAG TPA: hypothetical protein VMH05_25040 [Bryobacteraceae bacterium]|nr:hypothetical protein [Bryobacteraceae bacterium]